MSDKTLVSFNCRDQTLWPVYDTIGNLDAKMRQSQKRPGILLLNSNPMIHERLEDANNKNKNLKIKIYHIALKTISKRIYPSLSFIDFKEIRG